VVELREKIEWVENKPLFGLLILVAGSKQQAFGLAKTWKSWEQFLSCSLLSGLLILIRGKIGFSPRLSS